MNLFENLKYIIITILVIVVIGFYLGLSISTVVDYRLKDAKIHMPRPKNNIIIRVSKKPEKVNVLDNKKEIENFLNYKLLPQNIKKKKTIIKNQISNKKKKLEKDKISEKDLISKKLKKDKISEKKDRISNNKKRLLEKDRILKNKELLENDRISINENKILIDDKIVLNYNNLYKKTENKEEKNSKILPSNLENTMTNYEYINESEIKEEFKNYNKIFRLNTKTSSSKKI